jgi:diguanylate cyclase (GGDEF)-like protein
VVPSIRRPSDPEPGRLGELVARALRGGRSAGELYDGFLQTLRESFADDARLTLYTQDGEELRLQAQHGLDSVVGTLDLDAHLDDPSRTIAFTLGDRQALIDVGRPFTDDERQELASAVEALQIAVAALGRRAQTESATTRLSRAFVRIAAQNDGDSLLELTCRTIGDLLDLEAVQCLLGSTDHPQPGPLWRRSATSPAGVDLPKARVAVLALGGEPGRVGEYVIVPLLAGREWLGVLVGVTRPDAIVPPGAVEEAELVASHAATAYANLVRYQSVVAASLTDALTGLPNHRRFHEDGASLIDASRSSGQGFSLVIADLDDFKDLNDRRGHVAGDDALRLVATLFARGVRPDDRAYRVGGEEFALLLPATPKSNARTVCRRLQRTLAANDLDGWKLTCSLGIAQFPDDGETIRDLLAAADAALYEAKRLGKDRITLADEALSARRTQGESMAVRGRRSFEQMRHLQALAATLSGARTREAVGDAVLEELAQALPHDASALYLLDGGTLQPQAARGPFDAVAPALADYAGRAVADRRAFLVDDGCAEHPVLLEVPLHGLVAAPLVAQDRAVGAIVAAARIRSRYDRDDQRLLEVIATVAGLAFANLRLLGPTPGA